MRKTLGVMGYEWTCPLCDTGYVVDRSELRYVQVEEETENGETKTIEKLISYCPECERTIFVSEKDRSRFREVKLRKDFWDIDENELD